MELYYDADGGRSREISVSAVKLARRSGDAGALAYALQARRYAAWGPDTVEERLALAAEMVTLARTLNDPELAMAGHHTRFVALQEIGDMATAAEEATRQARLADELRQPYYQWHVMVYQAMRAVLDGRFDEGERLAAQAHDFGQRAEAPNAAQVFTLQVANLRWQQGRLDDAEAVLTAALDDYPSLPVWHCLRAALACARGRAADARRELDHVAGTGFTNLPTDLFWLSNMALLSETCAWLNDAACAAQLYEAIAPYATHNVMIGRAACLGPVTRYLGLLAGAMGQWARATRHVEDALAACARMGAKPLLAQTRRDLAALHERAKRTVLDAANAPQPLPAGLTARELTVLRMLAGGRSNPEIAAALSLSVKTVERHTVNIYAKIGARNRVDAAAYALRRGLA
jgi:DNA-binding CsgD family transcriptional regulator